MAMSEWQPIETAPRDGTSVLLYGPYQWEDYDSRTVEAGAVVGYFDGYRWRLDNANPYADYCNATHWMPLPAPPV